jgi:[ribosomal protein S18]-alanine N-acetyltransferase
MPLRRPGFKPDQAVVRPAHADDITAISRIMLTARHVMSNMISETLADLLGHAPGVVLLSEDQIWGAAVAGLPLGQTTWVRVLIMADGLPPDLGMAVLLPELHREARTHQIQRIYYGGDVATDIWVAGRLMRHGYTQNTQVISYAKHVMDSPAPGNPRVVIRPASDADRHHIVLIDQRCFEPQWTKGDLAIGQVFAEAPYCVLATLDDRPIGYALAMEYFGGRQVHLVRIAVLPEQQGQGVGVRMLDEVVAYARTLGAAQLTLNTQEYNTHARTLYEWFGFQKTGERQLILSADL